LGVGTPGILISSTNKTDQYNRNIVESGIKHYKLNHLQCYILDKKQVKWSVLNEITVFISDYLNLFRLSFIQIEESAIFSDNFIPNTAVGTVLQVSVNLQSNRFEITVNPLR
jgi:hypothetical protein